MMLAVRLVMRLTNRVAPVIPVQVFLREYHFISQNSVILLYEAHRKRYTKIYSLNQEKCCDAVERHKDNLITRPLSAITIAMA